MTCAPLDPLVSWLRPRIRLEHAPSPAADRPAWQQSHIRTWLTAGERDELLARLTALVRSPTNGAIREAASWIEVRLRSPLTPAHAAELRGILASYAADARCGRA